jgi:GR25 family glycosyltransferase involved in LPS biosynthesis
MFRNTSTFEKVLTLNFYDRFKNRFKLIKNKKNLSDIDMVYVICMPQRKDYITNEINKLGLTFTYLDAIKPSDLTIEDYENYTIINKPGSYIYKKYTRFAVLLSFILCFMDSLSKGYSTIVIFEDDIKTLVTPELLNKSLHEFKNSYFDVFYMGYCFLNCNQLYKKQDTLVEISQNNLLCCHSMAIKTNILPGLIKYCFPMLKNSDEMFRDYYLKSKIKVCVPESIYFTQNRNDLDSLNESKEDLSVFKTCKF